MVILGYLLIFIVGTAITTLCLWCGMKITKVDGPILGLAITASVCTLIGMIPIPYIGNLISLIVMCTLIYKFTNADRIWPDVILMVIVSRIVAFFGALYIAALLLSLFN